MNLPKKQSGGGDSWMNTYADMVTLLMCFFVMLFAMSTIDQAKWEAFVKSINPKADKVSQIPVDNVTPGEDDVPGGNPQGPEELDLEELFKQLQEYMQEKNLEGEVQMFEGDGYVFVTFKNSIFFDGDSSVLRTESHHILSFLADGLSKIPEEDLKEIRIMGHTNQDNPNFKNNIEIDRELSSMRASKVVSYLQRNNAIKDPKKIFGIGYGQWYPIAPYDTQENRQKNRRVEILIAKSNMIEITLDEIYEKIYGEPSLNIQDTEEIQPTPTPTPMPEMEDSSIDSGIDSELSDSSQPQIESRSGDVQP